MKERKASEYNIYMKENLPIMKRKNPHLPQSELMKLVAADYNTQKQKNLQLTDLEKDFRLLDTSFDFS